MTPQQIKEVLGQPIKINKLTVTNRMVMGPMAANIPDPDGAPRENTRAFFEARAKGGIGMIIVGGMLTTRRSYEESPVKGALRIDIEDFVPEFTELGKVVHAHNTPIIAELTGGFGAMGAAAKGSATVAASPKKIVIPEEQFPDGFIVPGGRVTPVPDEVTIEEIKATEQEIIESAVRVFRCGWDGVEFAAHMSYFAATFLSPRYNQRTDEYGGSLENRARMLVNIFRGIREKTSPDFILGLRLPANDYMPDGQGPEGFSDIAKVVEAEGIDYVALSTGAYETMKSSAPSVDGGLVNSGDVDIFKRKLSVPILVQGLHDPENAAKAIADGKGDMVMLARQTLADPDYARKVLEERPGDIVRCNRENECMRRMVFGLAMRCPVNPNLGREARKQGEMPPAKRFIQAPIEQAVLGLTGSKAFMGVVGAFMKPAD